MSRSFFHFDDLMSRITLYQWSIDEGDSLAVSSMNQDTNGLCINCVVNVNVNISFQPFLSSMIVLWLKLEKDHDESICHRCPNTELQAYRGQHCKPQEVGLLHIQFDGFRERTDSDITGCAVELFQIEKL